MKSYTFKYHSLGPDDIQLTINMFSVAGFTNAQLGTGPMQEPEKQKPVNKKYYMGISGGGWRAIASTMGVFRGLSQLGTLSHVDMFSSVSGGTWFLSKLAYDDKFAKSVLTNETRIGRSTTNYMEKQYFRTMKRSSDQSKYCASSNLSSYCNDQIATAARGLFTEEASLIPGMIKNDMASYYYALERFRFNWRNMVEAAILGANPSAQNLNTAQLAPTLRSQLKKQTQFAFNWLQFHQWTEETNRWFLKKVGTYRRQVAQYPVYTSAVYTVDGDESDLTVKAQGQPINELFDVCYRKHGEDVCGHFDFSNLTIGQVASASSAAVGGGMVDSWVKNVIKVARLVVLVMVGDSVSAITLKSMLSNKIGGHCDQAAIGEVLKFLDLGVGNPDPLENVTARWTNFLHDMAIRLPAKMSTGQVLMTVPSIDAVLSRAGRGRGEAYTHVS